MRTVEAEGVAARVFAFAVGGGRRRRGGKVGGLSTIRFLHRMGLCVWDPLVKDVCSDGEIQGVFATWQLG
jgi:hypothetical protein